MAKVNITIYAVLVLICNTLASNYPPRISVDSTIQQASESASIDTRLFTITAEDRNGGTVDIMATGQTSQLVNIRQTTSGHNATGDVLLKTKLDREVKSSHMMTFIATSSSKDAPASSLEVTLFVTDVNDEKPMFSSQAYRVKVPENHRLSSDINTNISATDSDNGPGGSVSYSIQPAGQALALYNDTFGIREKSGKLYLKKALDYEKLTFYQYKVIAKDGGNPQLNNSADLLITILDVQDTPPIFQGLPYMADIMEDSPVGTSIFEVFALDGDTGIPNNISYSISGNCSKYITMNPSSGVVSINKTMDRDNGTIKEFRGVCSVNVTASEVTNVGNSTQTNTTKPLIITVKDVNDNPPKFGKDVYHGSVKENMTDVPISIPGGISVSDIDQIGNNEIQLSVYKFDSIDTPDSDIVASPNTILSKGTFLLRLVNPYMFDYESNKTMNLTIIARDKKNSNLSDSCTLYVTINDTNDNDPVFTEINEPYYVLENSYFNTTVTNIQATDADSGNYGEITYILRGSNSFQIDDKTGRLYVSCNESCNNTRKSITDCDKSCLDREKKDVYYLTVEAKDGGGRRTPSSIVIRLNDTNDNKPIFRYSSYQIGLNENETNFSDGKMKFKVEATDRDQLNNSIISYSIVKSNDTQNLSDHFAMDATKGTITITTAIDYEQLPPSSNGQVILILMAEDHGKPSQSSTVTLTIDVKDVNDNNPSFAVQYNSSVKENANPGTFVLNVSAGDADKSKPNNQIAYFIEKGGSDQFTIDGTSGNISVQIGAKLDRETSPSYNLTVIAIDKGNPQLTGSTTVVITLEDENDTPPSWRNLPITVSVTENTNYTNVTQCFATDVDIDAILNYSIMLKEAIDVEGVKVNKTLIKDSFFINKTSGIVYTKTGFNAEVAVKLTFEVTVDDTQTLKNKPNATDELIININDTNDKPPVFSKSNYTAEVMENAPDGTHVRTLTATDADINYNNKIIKYYIDDTTLPFNIETTKGIVTKVGKIDREACDLWDVEIRATDSVHNATVTLQISILDFNDNTPYFLNNTYIFYENETEYNRTRIGALYADDLDSGQNANITFSISEGNSQHHFQIDQYTGDLFIEGCIDREKVPSYNLRVQISDNPSNADYRKSNTTQVTVHILDVNDNKPTFDNDSKRAVDIKESTVNGTLIKTVHATDMDVDKNSELFYQIGLDGNVSGDWFAINKATGEIRISNSLKDQAGNYTIQVLAIDEGVPSLNNSLMLNIHIIDENLHKPAFTNLPPNHIVSIFECAKNYTNVFRIGAKDDDKAFVNRLLKYEFLYPNSSLGSYFESFFLNETSGDIYVVGKIDHETRPEYKIRVRCTDHGDPPLSRSSPELTLQVLDVNDNNPEFNENITLAEVNENENGTNVIQVTAHDRDSKAFIQYSIKDGEYSDYFQIDKHTGRITTSKPLDREKISLINLMIQAKDVTKPENISSQCPYVHHNTNVSNVGIKVVVTVKDANDNPPNFTETHLSKGILRNTKFETVILDLTKVVTDKDVLPKNQIHHFYATSLSYTGTLKDEVENKNIKTNCGKAFCVHPNGSVVTNFVISETMKGLAQLGLLVNDSAGNSTASMKIYVISDSQIVAMHVIKTIPQVDEIKFKVLQLYSDIIGYDCVYDEMDPYQMENGDPDPFTTLLKFHVVNRATEQILEAKDVLKTIDSVSGGKGDTLKNIADLYSIKSINLMQSGPADQSSLKNKETYILIAVIALLSLILCIIIYFYIKSTKRYKTKLKAANIPTADRKEKKQSLHLPGSNVYSSTKNPLMNKDEEVKRSMENLDKLDDVSVSGSENSLDPSDFEYAKRTMTYEEPSEEKEVVMDMYVEDGVLSNSNVDPLALALSQHEKQKNEKKMNGNTHFANGQINQAYDCLETTEV